MSLRLKFIGDSGSVARMTCRLLLHVAMVLLEAADFEAAEVVLVHEAFHGRGEGGNRRGDRNAGDHGLGAHLDFIDHGFGAGLFALRTIVLFVK